MYWRPSSHPAPSCACAFRDAHTGWKECKESWGAREGAEITSGVFHLGCKATFPISTSLFLPIFSFPSTVTAALQPPSAILRSSPP